MTEQKQIEEMAVLRLCFMKQDIPTEKGGAEE